MIYIGTNKNKINYNPKNTVEEVMTNVSMILQVFKEEVPLNRDFAFDSDLIDKNINILENRITSHLLEIFRKYEPRVVLKQTQITMKNNGSNDFDITLGIEVIR